MLKKIFYWLFTVLQVLFLFAAYGIQYFSMKRMGMMRYVVFKNHEWEGQYLVTSLKYASVAVLAILCIISIIILCVKTDKFNHVRGKKALLESIVDIFITIIFIAFTLTFSPESYRSYYFSSMILAIVTLIQHIKMFIVSVQY